MRFLRLLVASLGLMAAVGGAAAAEPKEGVDYRTLDLPVRAEAAKKVEVVEFFMYSCPHCNRLDPLLAAWVKKQGEHISFHRVHMALTGPKDAQAHAYVTLEAMGKLDAMHEKIFHAIHVDRNRLNTDEALLDFISKNGVDKAQYLAFFNSFAVQTKLNRDQQLMALYKLDSAPTIVINGRFVTSPTMTSRPNQPELQSQQIMLQVMDGLVLQATGATPGKRAK